MGTHGPSSQPYHKTPSLMSPIKAGRGQGLAWWELAGQILFLGIDGETGALACGQLHSLGQGRRQS